MNKMQVESSQINVSLVIYLFQAQVPFELSRIHQGHLLAIYHTVSPIIPKFRLASHGHCNSMSLNSDSAAWVYVETGQE